MKAIGRAAVALYSLSMLSTGVFADPMPGSHLPGTIPLPRSYFSATIHCQVKNEVGQPFPGAWVSVNCSHYDIPKGYDFLDDEVIYKQGTDKHGQCTFRKQLPGTYMIFVEGNKCFDATQTVKVVANQITTVIITLHKWHRQKAAPRQPHQVQPMNGAGLDNSRTMR